MVRLVRVVRVVRVVTTLPFLTEKSVQNCDAGAVLHSCHVSKIPQLQVRAKKASVSEPEEKEEEEKQEDAA